MPNLLAPVALIAGGLLLTACGGAKVTHEEGIAAHWLKQEVYTQQTMANGRGLYDADDDGRGEYASSLDQLPPLPKVPYEPVLLVGSEVDDQERYFGLLLRGTTGSHRHLLITQAGTIYELPADQTPSVDFAVVKSRQVPEGWTERE